LSPERFLVSKYTKSALAAGAPLGELGAYSAPGPLSWILERKDGKRKGEEGQEGGNEEGKQNW